jgi:hypothetical protein
MKMPRRVFNVDGTENKQGTLTHYCLLRVKVRRKEDLQKFFITSLGGDQAIFGYPWLRVFNPDIDWKAGQVLGPPIRVETALLQWAWAKEINQIVLAARQHEDWEDGDTIIAHIMPLPTHAAQQWAIEANKNKQTACALPKRYLRHQHVFFLGSRETFPTVQTGRYASPVETGSTCYPQYQNISTHARGNGGMADVCEQK